MKTRIILFLLVAFSVTVTFSQKADMDPHYVSISLADLPLNYISPEKRTYSVTSYGSYKYTGTHNDDQINLYGWERVDKDATLQVKPNVTNFVQGRSTPISRNIENKDKDGKVTSTTTMYSYSVTNTGKGKLFIYGPKNELPPAVKKTDKPKEKTKKEKEADANPFLKGVDTKASSNNDDNQMTGNSTLPLAYTSNLDQSFTYTTKEYQKSSEALKEFNGAANAETSNHEESFIRGVNSSVNNKINEMYGYRPVTQGYVKFKKLDTDKHPEHDMYKNATGALKTIFAKMRYNKDTKEIEEDLKPIIEYFNGVAEKYNNKEDKGQRRLRAATMFNMAKIYQYLDQHDKTILIANQMIADKLEEDDAEDLIKESEEIKRQLAFHNMTSRHIVPKTADQAKDEVGETRGQADKP